MKLHFIRHGETQAGPNGTYGYSAPLTDLGHRQAAFASGALSSIGITHIVSSDARRAIQTAEPLVSELGLDRIEIPELTEIDIGAPSDGVTPFARTENADGEIVMDYSHCGGESFALFRDRVLSGLKILHDRFSGDDVIAVFTHGGVKNVAVDHYSGIELTEIMGTEYDNGSISSIDVSSTGNVIHRVNDSSHIG
jgi:broad specificity phosphatase PhoE